MFKHKKDKDRSVAIIIQCSVLFISLVLLLPFYGFIEGVSMTSLGASAFIVFAFPRKRISSTSNMIHAYVFGAMCGIIFGLLFNYLIYIEFASLSLALALLRALSVAIAVFLMVRTRYAHPPAAALALGLVSDDMRFITAGVAIVGTLILCLIKKALNKHMMDLIKY